jgi:hypothetical protein
MTAATLHVEGEGQGRRKLEPAAPYISAPVSKKTSTNVSSVPPSNTTTSEREGLELAQHAFGPLLNPVEATVVQWQQYTINRSNDIKSTRINISMNWRIIYDALSARPIK